VREKIQHLFVLITGTFLPEIISNVSGYSKNARDPRNILELAQDKRYMVTSGY